MTRYFLLPYFEQLLLPDRFGPIIPMIFEFGKFLTPEQFDIYVDLDNQFMVGESIMVCFGGEKVNDRDIEFDKLEIKCYLPEIPGKSRVDKIILVK